ncbi:MAG TPA: hybrid sensor histidine kinase/response regulator [Beijerinckiaceae bacterium]|nr:hybrid sensor histidine kinase/response regulator [Beijerinckiaceae bacterium]
MQGQQIERLRDLAHDLRSPLGGIDSMIELLAKTRIGPDQDVLIQGLQAASAHLRAVAGAMLAPAEVPGQEATTPLMQVLRTFSPSARARSRVREQYYAEAIDPSCRTILIGDATALRQVLENLVDNAFRVAPGGPVSLAVGEAIRPDGMAVVRLALSDKGPGLTEAEAAVVFERGTTLADRQAGTGLGLAIVRRLVEQAGGSCGASSPGKGQGATFWVEWPVAGRQQEFAESSPMPAQTDGGPQIVIVDDDATSRNLLKLLLDHFELPAVALASPLEALRVIESQRPAAILTDMSMPQMDGLAFVEAVRGLFDVESCPPIIAVTGRVHPEDQKAMREAGCAAIVEKPLTIHDLRQALKATGLTGSGSTVKAA